MGLILNWLMVPPAVGAEAVGALVDGVDFEEAAPESYFEVDSVWDCLEVIVATDARINAADAFGGGERIETERHHVAGLLRPDAVRMTAEALAAFDFGPALDAARDTVEGLCGGTIEDDDAIGFAETITDLRDFYAAAAVRGLAIVTWLT